MAGIGANPESAQLAEQSINQAIVGTAQVMGTSVGLARQNQFWCSGRTSFAPIVGS
jgi:hypothetical protein